MVETRNHSVVEEAETRITRPRLMNGYGLLPCDPTVSIPDNMIEVDINHMMGESPERKRAVMYLQLLRIVSGSTLGQNNMSMYKSYYKRIKVMEIYHHNITDFISFVMLHPGMVNWCILWKETCKSHSMVKISTFT